jgi:hypothetical protein
MPDVLTGYAPNNFSFTGAEFGPASGPSLDPGGGLQHAFLPAASPLKLNYLGVLASGVTRWRSIHESRVCLAEGSWVPGGISYALDLTTRASAHYTQAAWCARGIGTRTFCASVVPRVTREEGSRRARRSRPALSEFRRNADPRRRSHARPQRDMERHERNSRQFRCPGEQCVRRHGQREHTTMGPVGRAAA